METEITRIEPHELYSINAERAVLGGLMLDEQAFWRVSCVEGDFFRREHRLIWRAIEALRRDGEPTDVVTVADRLESWNECEDAGGLAYIGKLAEDTPSAANIAGYARILRDHAVRRGIITAATDLQQVAMDRSRDATEAIDSAQRQVLALSVTGEESRLAPMSASIGAFLHDLERRAEADDGIVGVPCGHGDVDAMIHGFEGGDLIIVAGRPSMGKTLLAEQWSEHIADTTGKPVAFFSLEMPTMQLMHRSAARNARIPLDRLRGGRLEEQDWGPLSQAMTELQKLPLYIDDTGGLTFAELRSRARQLHQRKPLSAIVVDYLQILQPGELVASDARADQKVGHVASGLKALAKELNIPVIAVAQLNRGVDSRSDKRPQMSDLRESGQVEQDADVISFVYRDDVYHDDSPRQGIAELIVRKQRNGPTGTVFLTFVGEYQFFGNFTGEVPEAMPKGVRGSKAAMDY